MDSFTDNELYFAKRREEIFEEFLKHGLTQTLLCELRSLAIESVKNSQPFLEAINIREVLAAVFGAGMFLCSCAGRRLNASIYGNADALCDYRAFECLVFSIISQCEPGYTDISADIKKDRVRISVNRPIRPDKNLLRRSGAGIFTSDSKSEIIIRYRSAERQTCSKTDDIGYLCDPLSYAYIYLCDICINPLIGVKP